MSGEISKRDIFKTLPPALKKDAGFAALGEVIAEQLAKNRALSDKAIIYPAIEKLSEEALDALAYDFNVSWYDYEGTLSEKRKTILECMNVHQYKGTKYAVETALRSVYDTVRVTEWFEYGGEPYHFKVIIYDSSNDKEKRARILAKVQYYKNLRSVLEETVFEIVISSDIAVNAAFRPGGIYKRIFCEVKNYGLE
ncbi:MAG: phage tail protein I [Oscillospiraceae bacterium]|nr:phage tail protein I [Oscillospiraceae bacterium]